MEQTVNLDSPRRTSVDGNGNREVSPLLDKGSPPTSGWLRARSHCAAGLDTVGTLLVPAVPYTIALFFGTKAMSSDAGGDMWHYNQNYTSNWADLTPWFAPVAGTMTVVGLGLLWGAKCMAPVPKQLSGLPELPVSLDGVIVSGSLKKLDEDEAIVLGSAGDNPGMGTTARRNATNNSGNTNNGSISTQNNPQSNIVVRGTYKELEQQGFLPSQIPNTNAPIDPVTKHKSMISVGTPHTQQQFITPSTVNPDEVNSFDDLGKQSLDLHFQIPTNNNNNNSDNPPTEPPDLTGLTSLENTVQGFDGDGNPVQLPLPFSEGNGYPSNPVDDGVEYV